jgi:hypothetical protein
MSRALTPEDLDKELGQAEDLAGKLVEGINKQLRKGYNPKRPEAPIQVLKPEYGEFGDSIVGLALAEFKDHWTFADGCFEKVNKDVHVWYFHRKVKEA